MSRRSQVETGILFEILVCAYIEGVHSSRKIEQQCQNHIQFILLLDGHESPDHCTIARFRSGKATGKVIEGLFWQYVNVLVEKSWVDRDELYVDGTKIESKAKRYTCVRTGKSWPELPRQRNAARTEPHVKSPDTDTRIAAIALAGQHAVKTKTQTSRRNWSSAGNWPSTAPPCLEESPLRKVGCVSINLT